ncbi:MAG: small subunit ribosomal protein S7 [Microgenomates group bacterium Gr01-1014_7]|nr:MAG: small subunit ribosomal protein S7 [Microgenomates group bacterium Gr01-1014_7]
MRSKKAPKRLLAPDPLYGSRLLARFINKVMSDGRKSIAQNLVYKALENIKEEAKQEPLSIFEKAIQNVAPKMEVRPRRVGGASYQVPVEVRGDRKEALAIRWILSAAKTRGNTQFHTFDKKLAQELIDAANNTGSAIKKRDDIQKTANANRAFSHFRW